MSRVPVALLSAIGIWLMTSPSHASPPACQYSWSVPKYLDNFGLEEQFPLAYHRQIRVVNLFWSDHWDSIPAHQPDPSHGSIGFLKQDINDATKALIASHFWEFGCQYNDPAFGHGIGDPLGPNPFVFQGDTDGTHAGPCASNPPGPGLPFTRVDAFNLAQCMELNADTGVPLSMGVPSPSCAACGQLIPIGLPCYLDPACSAVPNGTGDLLINIFVPRDAQQMSAVGSSHPPAFHWSVPSDAIGYIVPGTAGRPIYLAVYLLSDPKYQAVGADVNVLLGDLSHEMIEVFTDPSNGAFWNDVHAPNITQGEAADICDGTDIANPPGQSIGGLLNWVSHAATSPSPQTASVASYWSNYHGTCVALDGTAPSTEDKQFPHAGWNNSSVTVVLTSTDAPEPPSGVGVASIAYQGDGIASNVVIDPNPGQQTFSTSFGVSTEGVTNISFHGTDAYGNQESPEKDVVMIDRTPPTISVSSISPAANKNGWYGLNPPNNAPVAVAFSCYDALSGVKVCPQPQILRQEGFGQTVVGRDVDNAGNVTSTTAGPFNIDLTPPSVTYTGNQGTYDASDSVAIVCTATDGLSGIASTTCANIQGPAYAFGVGTSSFSASASDEADNTGTGATSFAVVVTTGGLAKLVQKFVSRQGVIDSLTAKLEVIQSAINRGDKSKTNVINAFINEIAAQTGKSISAGNAAILDYLVSYL